MKSIHNAQETSPVEIGTALHQAQVLSDSVPASDERFPSGDSVVQILKTLHVDNDTLVAALLADRKLRDVLDMAQVQAQFGEGVVKLINSVQVLNDFRPIPIDEESRPEQAERLRRLILALVDDVRAILIKLAYRLSRLRILQREGFDARKSIAKETLDIYTPLANRLGIATLKWELEDLAFRNLDPQTYKSIAKGLEEKRSGREEYVSTFLQSLRGLLDAEGIQAETYGRPKHIYSIWRKMQGKNLQLSELYDVRALRVIVDSVHDCYAALGVIHTQWHTIPKEFDDYIANRKPNGYQSLHTIVIGPEDKPIEIQIRTREMHEFAELGFAAHWRYKEGGGNQDQALNQLILSLRSMVNESNDDEELIDGFQAEAFPDRVFALTPAGDVMELSKGATPLDFAYAVHTQVGHKCRGAKIDGKIVTLTTPIKTGQQIEILTSKEPRPSRDWMNASAGYLASAGSRAKVRNWFHQQDKAENIEAGHKILEQTVRKLDVPVKPLKELVAHFKQSDDEQLLASIGRGDIRQSQLDALFKPVLEKKPELKLSNAHKGNQASADVEGVSNLLTKVAKCCKPVPGDDVVGYITQGQGVAVHRRDCQNLLNLPEDRIHRLIEISWGQKEKDHSVVLAVSAYDRAGLLNDITQILFEQKSNLVRVETSTDPESQDVHMSLTVQVHDVDHLTLILNKLNQVRNVFEATRRQS